MSKAERKFFPGRYLVGRNPWIYHASKFFIKSLLFKLLKQGRFYNAARKHHETAPASQIPFAANDMKRFLLDWGLGDGCTLMVHSRMDSLQGYSGTYAEIVEVLLAILGPRGTLCMPTFPMPTSPKNAARTTFDVRRTPSSTGLLSETFRRREGAMRSHQMRSVTALGPNAQELVSTHHLDPYTCGKSSPYYKLAKMEAKLLFLGISPFESNTMFHCAEDLLLQAFPLGIYGKKPSIMAVRNESGVIEQVPYFSCKPEFSYLWNPGLLAKYFSAPILCARSFADAECYLVDARSFLERVLALAQRGITGYGHTFPEL